MKAPSWWMRLGFSIVYSLYALASTHSFGQEVAAEVPLFSWWYLRPSNHVPADDMFRNLAAALAAIVVVLLVLYMVKDREFKNRRLPEFVILTAVAALFYPLSFALNLMSH